VFAAKGHPAGLGAMQATADVTTPRVSFTPFPGSATGLFEPGRVAVIAGDGLRLLYFTSYALWNYLCAPFLLARPGIAAAEIEPWTEAGQTWQRL